MAQNIFREISIGEWGQLDSNQRRLQAEGFTVF